MQQKTRKQYFVLILLIFFIVGLAGGVLLQKFYSVGNALHYISNTTNNLIRSHPTNTLSPTLITQNIIGTLTAKGIAPFFVFIGDSLTMSGSSDLAQKYPSQTMAIIGSQNYINLGIPGAMIADLNAYESTNIDLLVNPSYQFVLLVWIGANDQGTPLSTFTRELEVYWQDRHAAGYKIVAFTVLPRGDAASNEKGRVAMNDWIRSNWATYCDALVDVAAATELQDITNLIYFNKDQIHLTDTGYAFVAKLVTQEVARLNYGK